MLATERDPAPSVSSHEPRTFRPGSLFTVHRVFFVDDCSMQTAPRARSWQLPRAMSSSVIDGGRDTRRNRSRSPPRRVRDGHEAAALMSRPRSRTGSEIKTASSSREGHTSVLVSAQVDDGPQLALVVDDANVYAFTAPAFLTIIAEAWTRPRSDRHRTATRGRGDGMEATYSDRHHTCTSSAIDPQDRCLADVWISVFRRPVQHGTARRDTQSIYDPARAQASPTRAAHSAHRSFASTVKPPSHTSCSFPSDPDGGRYPFDKRRKSEQCFDRAC